MHTYLSRLTTERESLITTATQLAERAAADGRDLTESEQGTLATMAARGAEIDQQLTVYSAQMESARAYATLRSRLGEDPADAPDDDDAGRELATRGGDGAQLDVRAWGQQVVDACRSYSGRGQSDRVQMPGVFSLRAAADPIMLSNIPGRLMPSTLVEPPGPSSPPQLVTLVNRETVSTNTVEYLRWSPNVMPPAAQVAEGALKQPVDITAATVVKSLATYAGWKAITRQTLEDFPRIQSIVQGKLQDSLVQQVNASIAALLDAADDSGATGDGTLTAAIRAAIGDLQGKGYQPNAVALNPADWAQLDLSQTSLYNPGGTWGLTPVAVPQLAAGTTVVGDFRAAITLFDRGQTEIFLTDSHADFFLRNQLVILAEGRMLVDAVEPDAMQKVVLDAPTIP